MAVLTIDITGARKARILYGLTACHLVNDFYSMIFPVFLFSLIKAFGLSNLEAGTISFANVFISAIFQPTIGYYADLHQKRKMALIIGLVLCGVSMAALGLSGGLGFGTLLAAALLLGVAGSAYHPQSTNILAYFFPQSRGKASGIHGIGNALGFVTVFLAGGLFIAALGWQSASYLMIVPGVLAGLAAVFLFEEPATVGGRGALKGISRPLVLLTVVNGFNMMVFMGLVSFVPTFLSAKGGLPVATASILVALMLLPALATQPLGGSLSDRIGRRGVILLALGIATAAVIAFSLCALFTTWAAWQIVLLAILGGAVFSSLLLMSPVAMMFASELAVGERRGTTVGVVWGMSIAMGSLTPPLVGGLSDSLGYPLAFLSLAVLSIVGIALGLRLPGKQAA
ncbi:MAG: MFS transporter [Dehalococcoidia bacterium]|nr:MFS transporter [Dehalococcoidia bacterium]